MDYVRNIITVLNQPLQKQIKDGFTRGWIYTKSRRVVCGVEIGFRVPRGCSFEDVENSIESIAATCGKEIEIEDYKGVIVVRVIEKEWPHPMQFNPKHILKDQLLIGYNRMLEPVYHPLNVHMLIAGASKAGKTDALRWFAYQFLCQGYEVWICDLKGYSFFPFEELVHIAKDLESSKQTLASAITELKRRRDIIDIHRSRDIIKTFTPLVIIIDEAASLAPSQHSGKMREHAKQCDEFISLLGQQSREPKIFCLYATQRPDMNIINKQFKANVEASIAFRTKDQINSQIILGRPGAEKISPSTPGRCLYAYDRDYLLQVPFIGEDSEWDKLLIPLKTEVVNDGESKNSDQKRNIIDGSFEGSNSNVRTIEPSIFEQLAAHEKLQSDSGGFGKGKVNQGGMVAQGKTLAIDSKGATTAEFFSSEI